MVLDALRGYVQIATGLTEVTRKRATAAAKALVTQGNLDEVVPESVREQVTAVADELLAQTRANRDLLRTLVRGEVERVVGQLGLVPSEELDRAARRADRLAERVQELEEQIAATSPVPAAAAAAKPSTPRTPGRTSGTRPVTTRKAATRKTSQKASSRRASQQPAAPAAQAAAPSKPAATSKPAAPAAARKAVPAAKKSPVKKAATRKAAGPRPAARTAPTTRAPQPDPPTSPPDGER